MTRESKFRREHGITTFYISKGAFDRIKRDRSAVERELGEHEPDGFVEIQLGQKPVDALDRTHRCWWVNLVSQKPSVLRAFERIVGRGNVCEVAHGHH